MADRVHLESKVPGGIRVLSWNIRGALDKIKRGAVLKYAMTHRVDILMLQETHLMGTKIQCLSRYGFQQVYHAGFTRGSRGVAILIHRRVQYTHAQLWADPHGRYLFLRGCLGGEPLLLGCVYAPPPLQWVLVEKLRVLWADMPDVRSVIGGDWNDVLDSSLDRSRARETLTDSAPTKLRSLAVSLDWTDAWRYSNGNRREYTYLSATHHSFSRIDYIFVLRMRVHELTRVEILPRGLSDHSPVLMDLSLGGGGRSFRWRLSVWHLHNGDYRRHMRESIAHYLSENEGSVPGASIVWEAMKPTLRGVDISWCVAERRRRREHLVRAEAEILALEAQSTEAKSRQGTRHLLHSQWTYASLLLDEARQAWLATRSRVYQWGDKSGKMLYRLCQGTQQMQALPGLLDVHGAPVTDPASIAESFAVYYEALYTPHESISASAVDAFLADLPPKALSDDVRDCLELPLTDEELGTALGGLNPGKAPGPNGFPCEFFTRYHTQLAPYYRAALEEARDAGRLPPDWRHAEVVIFHKPGRPPDDHASYRPISLLNVEAKILAKALANRLLPHISALVHLDQAGFMPQRATRHNIRRAHVAVAALRRAQVPGALLLADMDRAFDSLSWEYLFALLRRLNLGPRFLSYLKLLYTDVTASVRVAGVSSSRFAIQRGTRQGCPLSPYLFALAMEPLAAWVRIDAQVRGFEWSAGVTDRIALYADDVLFFLTDLDCTGPRLLRIMQIFGETSGLHMNPRKSTLWVLGDRTVVGTWAAELRVVTVGLKYLGVFLTEQSEVSWHRNVVPVWDRIRSDIQSWSRMPLNIYGRSAIFKMMALPRLLYQLQNHPYPIAPRWFTHVNSVLGQFLWGGKTARVALKTCFISTYCGGLATSDIQSYYQAAHLLVLNEWWYGAGGDPAYALERQLMEPHTLHEILYTSRLRRALPPATQVIFQLWRLALRRMGWWNVLTRETPLWRNRRLPGLASLRGFREWDAIGVSTLGDVMKGTTLRSFQDMQDLYHMPKTQFYKYLQFRHALSPSLVGLESLPEFSPLEAKVLMGDLGSKKISRIYQSLVTHSTHMLGGLWERWEVDVGTLEEEDWREALASPRGAAISMRLRLVQFKYLHRAYYTRVRLWRAGLIASPLCTRCEREDGTFLHTVWLCHSLAKFWQGVFLCLSEVLGWELPYTPQLALLHVMVEVGGNIYKRHLLQLGLALAKRDIAREWRAPLAPSLVKWKAGMDFCMGLEQPIFQARGCPRKHYKIWRRWADYRGLWIEPPEADED